jgi:hypothetical protein
VTVEFEPVRLGARRRRIDPVAAGAIVVVIAVAMSVVKPWGDGSGPNGAAADAVGTAQPAVATPQPPATPVAVIPRIISASTRPTPSWADIQPVVQRHDTWGVRAIVSDGQTFGERWFRFPVGGTRMSTAFLDAGDETILALGVTFPPSQTPLDVRIWRETSRGLAWVDTEAFDLVPSSGAFLYGRPPIFGNTRRVWIPGTYRMDVLVDGTVRRLGISIPDRFSNVPAGSERPNLHDVRPMTDVPAARSIDVPYGLFATADGIAVPLPADEGPALDEVAAWLDVDPGTRRAPRSFVAEAYLPNATRLGVMLEARVIVMSANIARLTPEPVATIVPEIDHTPRDGMPSSMVLFRAPDDGAWTPGVYRITVVWADFDGLHEGSWHVDLRPGPIRQPAQMVSVARAWARYAGDTGIVRGTAEPLEGGPRSATIRLERAATREGAGYPLRDRLPCDGFRVDGPAALFGVAQPVDAPPATVTARAHFEYSQSDEQRILTASGNLPGLILVATDGRAAPISLAHRYRVGEDLDSTWSSLCVEVR